MKVKYNGIHEIMFDSPGFVGFVKNRDIIDMSEQSFEENRHKTENGNKIWTKEKENIQETKKCDKIKIDNKK